MASISGISIKALKEFRGHEGEPLFQGSLYLNGKKIGFWTQDSWGGPDSFQLEGGWKQEKMIDEAVKAAYPEKAHHGVTHSGEPYVLEYGLEFLMNDLLELRNDEKHFRNSVKKGYAGIVVATDGYHEVVWSLKQGVVGLSDEALLEAMGGSIADVKATFYPENDFTKHQVKIYRSLDDFVVGEPLRLKEKSVDAVLEDAEKRSCDAKGERTSSGIRDILQDKG